MIEDSGIFPQHSLGDDADEAIVTHAMQHPQQYVMKPQREGGGYNVWGEGIVDTLQQVTYTIILYFFDICHFVTLFIQLRCMFSTFYSFHFLVVKWEPYVKH